MRHRARDRPTATPTATSLTATNGKAVAVAETEPLPGRSRAKRAALILLILVSGAICALILSLLNPPSALAQNGDFLMFGAGMKSCGEYLQAADGERKLRLSDDDPDGYRDD